MARVLIVEDNAPLRNVIKHVLEAAGHQVHEAETGLEAIALIRAQPPEIVISDLVMPDQDGLGLIMTIRKELPAIPVIAMSGGVAHSGLYLDMASKLGAQRVLSKPFTAEQLLAALADVTGGRPKKPGVGADEGATT